MPMILFWEISFWGLEIIRLECKSPVLAKKIVEKIVKKKILLKTVQSWTN